MADYFTHFSCLLDVGTPENAVLDLATGETVDRIYTNDWLAKTISDEGGPL